MPEDWRCSFVEWLLVDKDWRSAGIGGALMERFALESSEAGRDTIIVSPQAGDDEQALLKFYYRLGYRRTVSGHVHRGPHGQQEHTPLPEDEMEAMSRTVSPTEAAELEEIMRRYRGSLGL
ncbi:GNAT family N-acetyltransferase [Arthrobacter luteolus]|uniref:GNAT family N-acetyltransferase n=1 Tax=Arthrobacter luteolus TaxID=98672 RepID=UPI000835DBB3|nr:GNAT family N-acetyltransferase [Arthrobacter luteolus]